MKVHVKTQHPGHRIFTSSCPHSECKVFNDILPACFQKKVGEKWLCHFVSQEKTDSALVGKVKTDRHQPDQSGNAKKRNTNFAFCIDFFYQWHEPHQMQLRPSPFSTSVRHTKWKVSNLDPLIPFIYLC